MAQEYEFRLRQLDSGDDPPIMRVLASGRTKVGRRAGSDLTLPSDRVSRDHAEFISSRTECRLIDLDSANHTKVNGEEIVPNVPKLLTHNAIVEFAGVYRFVFEQIVIGADVVEQPRPQAQTPSANMPTVPRSWEPRPDDADDSAYVPPPGLSLYGYRLLTYLPDIYQPILDSSLNGSINGFEYERGNLLPGEGAHDFMARLLGLFESILMPIEWNIDNFDMFLHADTAPASFLPWLASWFGIAFDSTWSEEQRRTLLREAHWLYARRGTSAALSRILEIYLDDKPEIEEYFDEKNPFLFRVKLPQRHRDRQQLIEAIINAHKPANTAYRLEFVTAKAKPEA